VDLINETVKTEQIWGAVLFSSTSNFITVSQLREEINALLNSLILNDFLIFILEFILSYGFMFRVYLILFNHNEAV
jgi:hypothetical protein